VLVSVGWQGVGRCGVNPAVAVCNAGRYVAVCKTQAIWAWPRESTYLRLQAVEFERLILSCLGGLDKAFHLCGSLSFCLWIYWKIGFQLETWDGLGGWRRVWGLGWGVRAGLAGRGVAGGPWGWLLGRWSACSRLRCGAQPWGGGAETRCALPGAKLRSDSRAKFDVEVRLAAHPPHGLRASPPAKSPPPRPARHATWVTCWYAQDYSKSRAKSDSCLRFI